MNKIVDKTRISRLGHATTLLELPTTTIITDPVLYNRIGMNFPFLGTIGVKRKTPPAMTVEELPRVDVILLSHAHMDHLDIATLRAMTRKQPYQLVCICALNISKYIKKFQWKQIYELDRDQSLTLDAVTYTGGETRHRGARYPWSPDRAQETLFGAGHNAYLIEYIQNNIDKQILFGGDTAYTHAFKKRSDKTVDVALMPIGAYDPFRFQHCTPEEALKMAADAHAQAFVAIHRNTFRLSREPLSEPRERLSKELIHYPELKVPISQIGESYSF